MKCNILKFTIKPEIFFFRFTIRDITLSYIIKIIMMVKID